MECLLQYLDDVDDLIWAVGLLAEKIRSLFLSALFIAVSLAVQVGGVLLALSNPPIALAAALIMFVTLLYRSVTGSLRTAQQAL